MTICVVEQGFTRKTFLFSNITFNHTQNYLFIDSKINLPTSLILSVCNTKQFVLLSTTQQSNFVDNMNVVDS